MMSVLRLAWQAFKPDWVRAWQTKRHSLSFEGPFQSWQHARSRSRGYDDKHILNLTIRAARRVVTGQAAYDRDTVTFNTPQPDVVLLLVLSQVTRDKDSGLCVLDFGGSLGSTYRQNRAFLTGPLKLEWHIIEQPAFAEAGAYEFASPELHFHSQLETALACCTPDFLLLSSVLQYLEHETTLASLTRLPVKCALITRTPFWDGDHDFIVIQNVPTCIYKGSYPMRIFSRSKMLERWEKAGMVVATAPAPEGGFSVSGIAFTFETWTLRPSANIGRQPS